MTPNGIGSHQSTNMRSEDWITPLEIVQALGEFDLDPCASDQQPWKLARRQYTRKEDGLARPWTGSVWLNPPYGRKTGLWLKRLADHNDGVALIFARTETRMWFDWVWPRASAIFFFEGRLHFCLPDGTRSPNNSGAPSALIAYGPRCSSLLQHSGLPGKFIPLIP